MVAKILRITKKNFSKETRVPVELGDTDRLMLRELAIYYGTQSSATVVRLGMRRMLEDSSEVSIENYIAPAGGNVKLAQITLPGHWKAIMIRLREHFEFQSHSEIVRYIINRENDAIASPRKRAEKFCEKLEIADPLSAA